MGGLRSALTQFQKLFHVDACDARGVRLPASSPITPSNVGVSVWTPTSRTSAQRRALPSVATPPAGAYLFILFLCDHLTEYFTNLMILLYNEYYVCSCGALALVAAAAAATAANATDGEVPAVPNHKDGDKQVHRSSPAHRCRGRGVEAWSSDCGDSWTQRCETKDLFFFESLCK